ncbi:DEAD/DEAH box helicase [Alkalihalobacillus sp. AL-G]|uniref:DEAD/DEAH box helicase n=1 Tax=Alkalihalobacillus sp. AL-G TaxID=2926399 RepID=UPI00272D77A9|nr:DEAD/DEAH box helicase [Alkalihalobacillus sp. AL-G]WLD93880.1 DEAD/DEAH box helicase [Alkalihalobacillus sp. AL-G]
MTTNWDYISTTKPFIQKVWEKAGFNEPTTIQTEAVPFILEGKDVIAESPTGTGKTLAYLLPILERIDVEQNDPQAVILASSRELVMQIFEEVQKWTEDSGIKGASIIGGANPKRQLEKLKKHPQVIIGTPGRVEELIKMKKLKMHEVKTVVLDEVDQLLVPEHLGTVRAIIKSTLNDRQLLLFSATLSEKAVEIGKELTANTEVIRVKQQAIKQGDVDHLYFISERRDKIKVLEKFARMTDVKALAFGKDIGELQVLKEKMDYKNVPVGLLHSELKKNERQTALKQFRSGKTSLLLATDVAARGLDVKGLTHVIQIDVSEDKGQYLHRAGRTGRAGASGTVVTIVTKGEEQSLNRMARALDIQLQKKSFYKGKIVDER